MLIHYVVNMSETGQCVKVKFSTVITVKTQKISAMTQAKNAHGLRLFM